MRRSILTAVGLIAAISALACSDSLFGGARGGGHAHIAVQPRFSERDAQIYASLKSFGLSVTSLTVAIIKPGTTDTVAQTTITVGDTQDSVLVSLEVPVVGNEEHFTAGIVMFSGTLKLFEGSVDVVARPASAGVVAPALLVPVWVGPGTNATSITISPRDLTMAINSTLPFTATATDVNGVPVADPEFVSRWRWRVSDTSLASIPLVGGIFTAKGTPGVVKLSVVTPTLLRDTVTITISSQLPLAKVRFLNQLATLDRGTTATVPATATDVNGSVVSNATFTYTSRTPSIATVNASGAISGVSKGEAVIVVQATAPGGSQLVSDSLLAIIAEPNAPALVSSLDKFIWRTDTTLTVSIFADMRNATTKLGSTTIDVQWNPAQLTFQGTANGASGVSPTVNSTNAANGTLTLAMADAAGFSGRVELLRITLRTASSATTGQLTLSAREMSASDYTDLLPNLVQVTQPLSVRVPPLP
jgi:hypothetical protein